MRSRTRFVAWTRALGGACAVMVSVSACASFAGAGSLDCAAPPVVSTSGHQLAGDHAVVLWQPDGQLVELSDELAAEQPVFSPDGRSVAVELGQGEWSDGLGYPESRVAVLSVDTHELRVVSADVPHTRVARLHWSADGSEVAFIRDLDDGREIVAVDVETGEEQQLLRLSGRPALPDFAWSPDGRELLVNTQQHGGSELRRWSVDTGRSVVVQTPDTLVSHIAWSPDGRSVALAGFDTDTVRSELFALDLGTGRARLVDDGESVGSVTWSGPYLLYTYAAGSSWTLRAWDARTGERTLSDRPGTRAIPDRARISAPACP
jgi:Tol biopolymer transport system component